LVEYSRMTAVEVSEYSFARFFITQRGLPMLKATSVPGRLSTSVIGVAVGIIVVLSLYCVV
jgi:hypothetical protein